MSGTLQVWDLRDHTSQPGNPGDICERLGLSRRGISLHTSQPRILGDVGDVPPYYRRSEKPLDVLDGTVSCYMSHWDILGLYGSL